MSDTMTETSDVLQGVREIARYLNIKERTAEYWIELGRIPVKRMGKGRTVCARKSLLLAVFNDDDSKAA
jgi:excisionase family DNA binding protein